MRDESTVKAWLAEYISSSEMIPGVICLADDTSYAGVVGYKTEVEDWAVVDIDAFARWYNERGFEMEESW